MQPANASSSTRARFSVLARLSRREWMLVMLGLGAWVALGFGGVWFVHQFTRSKSSCGGQLEARTAQPKGQAAGPRNSLQLLTGTGRCE